MGAVVKLDVEGTSETVSARRRAARRRVRAWPVPFDPSDAFALADNDNDFDVDVDVETDNDFDDELTDPDPLSDLVPTWAPADIGQALIDEWDASAAARASRPSLVARVLGATAEDTAITSFEKPAIRSAS